VLSLIESSSLTLMAFISLAMREFLSSAYVALNSFCFYSSSCEAVASLSMISETYLSRLVFLSSRFMILRL
jgi:hypothetical protein